jgi:SAM-dependent methyltransferase
MSSSILSPEFKLTSVAFFGRTLEEYLGFFALKPPTLRGRRILDVAAGPSSFTAEARSRGIEATAVDPLYGLSAEALSIYVDADYRRVVGEMRRSVSLLHFGGFADIDAAEASRRSAATRFLADYEAGFAQGRYVGGALPRLPFANRSFDLVLSAHFLFTYCRHFDFSFHLEGCAELARVSAGEVRIHPLCGPDTRPYPELTRLRSDLETRGIRSDIVMVPPQLFGGNNATLILNPNIS